VGSRGEERDVGRVAAVDIGVRDAASDGEVAAVVLEVLQIGGKGVVFA